MRHNQTRRSESLDCSTTGRSLRAHRQPGSHEARVYSENNTHASIVEMRVWALRSSGFAPQEGRIHKAHSALDCRSRRRTPAQIVDSRRLDISQQATTSKARKTHWLRATLL